MRPSGLTAEQKAFYAENGYILAKGVFTPAEAAEFRAEAHALADRLMKIKNIDATWASVRNEEAAKKTIIYHCHDVQFHSAVFTRMVYDPRLTAIAADVVGPNVQLHHTKMFIKPPENGSPFPMHQDQPFFPHANHSMIAAIIHFDEAPIEKGCVRVVPGSHKRGPLAHSPEGSWHLPFSEFPVESATPCPASAGDVLFFSYLTVHGSGINQSDEARTTLLIQMRDPADPPEIYTHESRGQGTMLYGVDPLQLDAAPAAAGAMGGGMGAM